MLRKKERKMDWQQLFEIRKHLHKHPELSFAEYETTEFIASVLHEWGIPFHRFKNLKTGGYADVGTNNERIFAFRSDIDALPIEEEKTHAVVSQRPGVMHACGHDFHTTIGLGLLKYFSENPQALKGTLRVVFQPGEEAAPGGAEKVVQENIWQGVRSILTVHVQPQVPTGTFVLFHGAVQASSTSLHITLKGPGGHTSRPYETADLIHIGSQYVVQLQSFLKQKTDPRETVVLAFGSVHGGSTHNIIPDEVVLRGTLRTLDNQVLANSLDLIRTFSADFAALHKIHIDVRFPTNCPATVNDARLSAQFAEFMKKQRKDTPLTEPDKPSLGSDDFSFYLSKVPGLYLLMGAGGSGSLHSAQLQLDANLLKPAVETLAGFFSFLSQKPESVPENETA